MIDANRKIWTFSIRTCKKFRKIEYNNVEVISIQVWRKSSLKGHYNLVPTTQWLDIKKHTQLTIDGFFAISMLNLLNILDYGGV